MRASAITASAPGKVNLHFQAGPPRADGYHAVASLYAAVDHTETVEVSLDPQRPAGRIGCELRVVPGSLVAQQQAAGAFDPSLVPLDERNLAVRAARAVLAEASALPCGIRLRIDKSVPVAGGMGGGSADAAAALEAAGRLVERETGHRIAPGRLREIGSGLGADVPFAMAGGAAVGTGTGTELAAVPISAGQSVVLVADAGALSTPAVFAALDRLRSDGLLPTPLEAELDVPAQLLRALADGDAPAVSALLANDLQAPALEMAPHLRQRLAELEDLGARALISGSGPTIVGFPRRLRWSADEAQELARRLRSRGACAAAAVLG
ncbi:4-(cytidine 5'-diphospho)-2-C-methyl-D-erythritol kinase [Kocuria palustris]|uniref:GHMP family kinase ATP-binding protein n=1 Tax=Kocuria palustris TaxID=71999 RepID=UPI0011A9F8D4|nr:4-(cytidine 5'-diphospho)-2-C-methyl-D-erythritol kinase [Kocuria palustris]